MCDRLRTIIFAPNIHLHSLYLYLILPRNRTEKDKKCKPCSSKPQFADTSYAVPATLATESSGPPKIVPPPTPIHLPRCQPRIEGDATTAQAAAIVSSIGSESISADIPSSSTPPPPPPPPSQPPRLTTILHSLLRPAEQVDISHLELLGVHVHSDSAVSDIVPDPACLPDFEKWDALTREQAHALDTETRPQQLCNGRNSPGASKYVDLRQGLLTDNDGAFRAVRRVAPRPGEQYVRLGYCHEFFRYLESITAYWDDTSTQQPTSESTNDDNNNNSADNGNIENAGKTTREDGLNFYRTSAGTSMPIQYRVNLLTSFLKLVTYDFSCNIMCRQGPEPRLYVKSPSETTTSAPSIPTANPKHSYFSSGCNFLFRMPQDRETARRGIIDGPIAAISPRHTTLFPPRGKERESVIDLSREIVAALITAQNRAREGRAPERIGKDAWWATKPRWGGGPGGPVGKEEELLELRDPSAVVLGDKDEKLSSSSSNNVAAVEGEVAPIPPTKGSSLSTTGFSPLGVHQQPSKYRGRSLSSTSTTGSSSSASSSDCLSSSTQPPHPKRPRIKGLAIYDNYRMIRPPAMHWDPKTNYTAIGRQRGVNYDDVFVISSLFHHVSLLRVRVPDTLLAVLAGEVPDPGLQARGGVGVWRTRWFDLFVGQDRVDAMKALWGVMAYAMRKEVDPEDKGQEDEDEEEHGRDAAKKHSPSR